VFAVSETRPRCTKKRAIRRFEDQNITARHSRRQHLKGLDAR